MADNNENKVLNVPPLRFPEFSGEWDSFKLVELGKFIGGGTPSSSKLSFWTGSIPWISSSDIKEDNINNISISRYITEEAIEKSATKYCPAPVILIVSRVGVGKVALSHTSLCTSQDFCNIIEIKCHPVFLSYNLLRTMKRKSREVQGTSIKGITSDELQKMRVFIPKNKDEQNKISNLLTLLDERIATQNKIIEDLKKLKSAIVEMLLCNRNSELLKLGDIGYFVRGLTYANEDVTENKAATAVIRANNLNYGNHVDKGEVVYVSRTPATSQILQKGDIVICMANGSSALVGKNSYYPFNDGQSTVGAFCGIYRTSHPLAKWLMQSRRYKRLVYQSLQGGNGAIANLNGDDILNMSFPVMEKEKSKSIIFILETIEKSLAVNKGLQRSYSTQKSHLLKQMFI